MIYNLRKNYFFIICILILLNNSLTAAQENLSIKPIPATPSKASTQASSSIFSRLFSSSPKTPESSIKPDRSPSPTTITSKPDRSPSPTTITSSPSANRNRSSSPVQQTVQKSINLLNSKLTTKKNPVIEKSNEIIQEWLEDYGPSTSNGYIQANLQDALLSKLFKTDATTKRLEALDSATDFSQIKKEYKKLQILYKDNPDITKVLDQVIQTISQHQTSTTPVAIQTNQIITPFYNHQQAQDLLNIMNIAPIIDQGSGQLKNIPSVEMIITEAKINPTQKSFEALNNAIKSIRIADNAILHDKHFGSQAVQKQLKKYDKELNDALTNPAFDTYKSFALKNILENTGLSNMTIASLLESAKSGVKISSNIAEQISVLKNDPVLNASGYVATGLTGYARMGLSGALIDTALYHLTKEMVPAAVNNIKKMSLGDFIELLTPSEKTSIINAHATMNKMNSGQISLTGELSKIMNGSNKEQIQKAQFDANKEIAQFYYKSDLKKSIFDLMQTQPNIDPLTGNITNMPSIDTIIAQSKQNSSKISYDALQAALKATNTALYANQYDTIDARIFNSLKSEQLFLYKEKLLDAIKAIKDKSSLNRVADYATSLVPTSTDIIKATGVMDTTIEQLSQGNNYTSHVINTALKHTGIADTTLNNILTHAEVLPAQAPLP